MSAFGEIGQLEGFCLKDKFQDNKCLEDMCARCAR